MIDRKSYNPEPIYISPDKLLGRVRIGGRVGLLGRQISVSIGDCAMRCME